jgi:CubicO group peptidase (beta-lactamase class C family)
MRTFLAWSLIVLLGAGMSCASQKQLKSTNNSGSSVQKEPKTLLEQQIDSIVLPLVDSSNIVGIVIGVMRHDSILLLKPYGKADLEFDVPMPANASFEIGSVTKQFTAVAVMQLVSKGLIKLDDRIDKYITFNTKYPITIRQLLHHTSGIKDVPKPLMRGVSAHYPRLQRDTLLRLIEKEGFEFEPGTSIQYSNKGYFTLGLLIEKVSGISYETYLAENVFKPAGMTNTYYTDDDIVRKNRAHGYNGLPQFDKHLIRAESGNPYWTFAAGAFSSTADDLLRYNYALHKSNKILDRKNYQDLLSTDTLKEGTALRYAKGMQVYNYKGHRLFEHGGAISGFISKLMYFPEEDLSIVELQNVFNFGKNELAFKVADKLLEPRFTHKADFDLTPFKGDYVLGGLTIKIHVEGNNLVIYKNWRNITETLTYAGDGKWASPGSDLYYFKKEGGEVKGIVLDAVAEILNFTKSIEK